MSRPKTGLTGPGYCENCGKYAEGRTAFGLCRHCYDQQRKKKVSVDQALAMYAKMLSMLRRLRDSSRIQSKHYDLFSPIFKQYVRDLLDGDGNECGDEDGSKVE